MLSKLNLVHPPISTRNYILKKKELEKTFNKAILYFFCKRKPLIFHVNSGKDKNNIYFDLIHGNGIDKVSCTLKKENISSTSFTSYSKDKKDYHEICIKYASGEVATYTPEDILFKNGKIADNITIDGDVTKLACYEVLYVGETVDQGVSDRLGSRFTQNFYEGRHN